MADIPLNSGTVPAGTQYPGNFQEFLDLAASYLSVDYPDRLKVAMASSETPTGDDINKLWVRLSEQDGRPLTLNLYNNGTWLETTQFQFGDIVLVPNDSEIVVPWGVGGTFYSLLGKRVIAPPTPTTPPTGYKYKVYVGNYL